MFTYPNIIMMTLCVFFLQLCAPLLSNHQNHLMWPNLMSEDVIQHTERMCSKMTVVQGQVLGETVLPIPTLTDWIENSYSSLKM